MKRNLTHHRYGKLTVLEHHHTKGEAYWLCQCDCGKTRVVMGSNLTCGRTRSCGCLRNQDKVKHRKPDGYNSWKGMWQRCTNPNEKGFKHWGGRGITVCERWKDFRNFIADMGPRPGQGYSIERINNDLGYSPQNCCWATASQQQKNRRRFNRRKDNK